MVSPANRNEKDASLDSNQDVETAPHQAGKPTLDRVTQARIGDKLRAMYGELTEQPVPDRFRSILDRLGKD